MARPWGAEQLEGPDGVADVLYLMLNRDLFYLDRNRVLIDDPTKAPVFLNALVAAAKGAAQNREASDTVAGRVVVELGASLVWDGSTYEIVNIGETSVALRQEASPDGKRPIVEIARSQLEQLVRAGSVRGVAAFRQSLFAAASERFESADLEHSTEAKDRWLAIREVAQGRKPAKILTRNQARWLSDYRAEDRKSGFGFAALLPQGRPGNRTNHPVVVSDDRIIELIKDVDPQPWHRARIGVIRRVRVRLADEGITALPSVTRCRRLMKKLETYELRVAREGSKAAYSSRPPARQSALDPSHGVRPMERGQIDATRFDIQLVDSEFPDLVLGHPWIHLLIDEFAHRRLSFWLSFDPPSYRSDMMALRRCVQLYNRVTEVIVSDGGSPYGSAYYEILLAALGSTPEVRPPAMPRFGSVIERLFGTVTQQFVYELRGNTQASRAVRTLTPAVDPKRYAVMTLLELYESCEAWFEAQERRVHPALRGQTPLEAHTRGLERSGKYSHTIVPYDDDFIRKFFLPTNPKGVLTIKPSVGLRFKGGQYWNDAFRAPRLAHKAVPIRYDPWDLRYLTAFVDGKWVRCDELRWASLPAISEPELKLAIKAVESEGVRRAAGFRAVKTDVEIGRILLNEDARGELLVQRRRDAALREIIVAKGLTLSSDAAPVAGEARDAKAVRTDAVGSAPLRIFPLKEYQ